MSEVASNLDASQNFDAKQATEEIATGDRKVPEIDVSADYEASKEFSVSEIDQTQAGEQAAEEATAHQFELHEPENVIPESQLTSNPEDFTEMAKEVGHTPKKAGEVTDDLVQKALELGQPGNQ